ncbi:MULTISPECIES: signal peptidase II [Ruminococcus]|uniref:Lipoprotein signal peptidase n=1 Tax=Ruminococcus flavefaciens TaxID=1265 RepID=A0A1M7LHN8_RUMFL|nr:MULTISPECIES: signal peptidase II [Ruminococcus]MCR4794948.1 signal peptidase II [Ruminococcus sp.]SHM77688.1 signal peptidase II [Ruminococcus flavefaciens]
MAILLGLMIAALVGADQLVKYWAVHDLKPVGTKEFIHFGDFRILDLTYLENDGAIFGSMSGQRWFLVGFTSLVVIGGIILLFKSYRRSRLLSIALALFIAGGIGNLIDRFRFSYVVDMFEVKLFHFAIFNVADICVTVAFAMLLIYGIFIDPKIEKAKKAEAEKAAENE